uniref:Eyes absent homolog n=1 Tax=Panagrolaimus davidi TaxID=227884 RepID=A0A914PR27_9BILA
MPVNHAALEAAVYGSTGGTGSGIQNSTTTNPYCTPIGYNNSAAAAAAAYANPYSYHMAIRNAAPFTNYFNSLGSTVAANVGNSAAYYSGYGTTTNPTGFDYNSYASSNQYYPTGTNSNINSNTRAAAAANNYYNATAAAAAFPYGTLAGTEALPTSSSTLISASQISPYSTVTTNQKSEHKPPRRNKKKKPIGGLASPEPSYARVFVYELEDFCSFIQPPSYFAHFGLLLDNIISQAFGIHIDECDQANVEDANVDEITDLSYSNSNQIQSENNALVENEQKPDVNSLSESPPINAVNRGIADGLQQMARRYQRMKDVYNKCKDNIGELTNYMPQYSSEQIIGWIKQHDVFVENYRQCLRITIERSTEMERFTNVVISNESLASTMAKLLLCNLAAYIPVENIYSSHKIGKAEIIDRASLRFKKNMIIASSIQETREIAKKERIPVWPIRNLKDIDTYYHAIDKVLTMS